MYQLDRSKCKYVEVKEIAESAWTKRILVNIDKYNKAICVIDVHEQDFLEGGPFETIVWNFWREIKKPEWKPFEKGEDLLPFIDCWFRYKTQKTYLRKPIEFDIEDGTTILGGITYDLEELFHGYEMQIDGKWQPVGYLDGE